MTLQTFAIGIFTLTAGSFVTRWEVHVDTDNDANLYDTGFTSLHDSSD